MSRLTLADVVVFRLDGGGMLLIPADTPCSIVQEGLIPQGHRASGLSGTSRRAMAEEALADLESEIVRTRRTK